VVPDVAPVASRIDFLREADRVLLATFAPPGVLIDDALEILQYRGETGTFLTPAPGTPSNNLRRMARDGLFPDLGDAIEGARSKNANFRRSGLRVKTDAGLVEADIEVIPIHPPLSSERRFLVLFRQVAPPAGAMPVVPGPAESEPAPDVDRQRIAQLERELASNKEYLRAILEEREATNEELRAANEELLSSNEELQSTNEELQTAHEELQATNEELLTVNEELQNRNDQATRLTDDLTNLLSSVQLPIVMLGLDLRIRRFTPSAAKLLNLTPSDLDRPILDLKPKFDVQDMGTLLAEVMETKVERQREVQDREGHWYSLWIRPYRTQNNRVEGAVIVLSDVDELKRGAQRLRQARDFAESIVMTVREPLLVLDSALRVVMANNAVRETFGTVPAAIPAAGQEERAAGQWRIPGLLEKIEEVWARGSTFEDFEVEAEFPELGRRFVRMNARRVQGDAEEQHLILLAIEDVTDRRRAEAESALVAEKFHETQRLESLGVLAGGIAHDFNNILAAILGYAELVQTELPPGSRLRPHVENIEKSAGRAADLCRQILAYSGRGRFVVQPLNLSALVEDLTPLLRATASKKAVFRFELDDALPAVMGDAAQLNQVAMNLVINASEALGNEGGTIIVRTGRMRADRDYLAAARVSPGNPQNDYVYLEVADDGCGMDSDTLARAFDPFFSRKLAGRGVGLSAVLGIVRGHQGALKIDSEPGRGTNFRVLFPAVDSPAKAVARSTPGEATWRGQGTVLIVDDEDAFRAPLKQMLGRLGFRVLEAADGRSGVEAFRAAANQIDVVLLDLTMPHMDGAQTFHELRKLRPSARVILMSGYDERQTMEGFAAQGLAGFLQKPFHYADLTETLRKVLEGDPRKPKPQ
jgi:two-component system CheB/CheR fusion protein